MSPVTPVLRAAAVRPHFVTVAELATMLRVSKMTVYRMARSGEVESVRVGRSIRIPMSAASAVLSDGASSPSSELRAS